MIRKLLLVCGILSTLLYICMNIFIPLQWDGYSPASQAISELSAIGAPTRSTWVPLGIVYTLLMAAFGCAVWMSAGVNRRLRVAGALLVFSGLFGLFWPPMHLRGDPSTITDTLHILWSIVTLSIMVVVMGLGASVLGKRFLIYTVATLAVWLACGTLTFMDASRLADNRPTPRLGIWERINIGAYMIWIVVFATMLLALPSTAIARVPRRSLNEARSS